MRMANVKLTQEQIDEITKAYKGGETMLSLSKRYDVHINTIAKAIHKNGVTRPYRSRGEYVRISVTIERKLFNRLPTSRSVNLSMVVNSLLENWADQNVPNSCQ